MDYLARAKHNIVSIVREKLVSTQFATPQHKVDSSYKDCLDSKEVAIEIMHEFAREGVNAVVPVGGWPMYLEEEWKQFVNSNRHLTLVVGDALPVQLDLMNKGYVNGLVGQTPFNMGTQSMNVLFELAQGRQVEETIYGTALLEVMQFPLVLPDLDVDENRLGNLVVMGYVLFSLIAAVSLCVSAWVYLNRDTRVIRASQPFFLQMVLVGVLVFSSAIVPLSVDMEHYSQKAADVSCMSVPWLTTIGFTTMFSALYSKTRRINLILQNPQAFKRIKVTEKDVIKPYLAIMAVNIATLSCWTALAPLKYRRFDHPGTDDWNRIIATYGVCVSVSEEGKRTNAFVPFLAIISAVNFGLLFIANVQAYHARKIQTEYSESKYIAVIMASMLQAFVLGVPCIFLLWDVPRGHYTVLVMVIACVCAFVLSFMFWPKVYYTKKWRREQEERRQRRDAARALVIRTTTLDGRSPGGGRRDSLTESRSVDDSFRDSDLGLKVVVVPEPNFGGRSSEAGNAVIASNQTNEEGGDARSNFSSSLVNGPHLETIADDRSFRVSFADGDGRSEAHANGSSIKDGSDEDDSDTDGDMDSKGGQEENNEGPTNGEENEIKTLDDAMKEIERLRRQLAIARTKRVSD